MTTLLIRIRELLTANAHHAIDRAEHPTVMSAQVLRDLDADILRTRQALVRALGAVKLLEQRQAQFRQSAGTGKDRARRLLEHDEADAREALRRSLHSAQSAEALEAPLHAAQQAVERVRAQLDRLVEERASVQMQSALIDARQTAAGALACVADNGDAFVRAGAREQTLARLSDKAQRAAAEAEAAAELLDDTQRYERRTAAFELDRAVDAQMQLLKTQRAAADSSAS